VRGFEQTFALEDAYLDLLLFALLEVRACVRETDSMPLGRRPRSFRLTMQVMSQH
jgi:hypothetical protein